MICYSGLEYELDDAPAHRRNAGLLFQQGFTSQRLCQTQLCESQQAWRAVGLWFRISAITVFGHSYLFTSGWYFFSKDHYHKELVPDRQVSKVQEKMMCSLGADVCRASHKDDNSRDFKRWTFCFAKNLSPAMTWCSSCCTGKAYSPQKETHPHNNHRSLLRLREDKVDR